MNITFFIGNGFDINRKLSTSYIDFYSYAKSNSLLMNNTIFNEIKKEVKLWSDFELQLGAETTKIQNENEAEAFMDDFEDLHSEFLDYLEDESKKYKPTKEQVNLSFKNTMRAFYSDIDEGNEKIIETKIFNNRNEGIITNFLNFNYTDTLTKYWSLLSDDIRVPYNQYNISITPKKPIHIHNDLHNSALLGVNDVTQIAKTKYFSEDDLNFLIKPNSTAINNSYTFQNAENIINSSNIIVVYGMSLGSTDKKWWELIGKWLKNKNTYLIIHYFNNQEKNPRKSIRRLNRNRNKAKSQFLEHLELNSSEFLEIQKRIFISINSNHMFNDINVKKKTNS